MTARQEKALDAAPCSATGHLGGGHSLSEYIRALFLVLIKRGR